MQLSWLIPRNHSPKKRAHSHVRTSLAKTTSWEFMIFVNLEIIRISYHFLSYGKGRGIRTKWAVAWSCDGVNSCSTISKIGTCCHFHERIRSHFRAVSLFNVYLDFLLKAQFLMSETLQLLQQFSWTLRDNIIYNSYNRIKTKLYLSCFSSNINVVN